MGPVDDLELSVLANSGDLALAEQVGAVCRQAVRFTAECVAQIVGDSPDAVLANVEAAMLGTSSSPAE